MITYLQGDATEPQTFGPKLIVHVVNSLGGWGKGFVVALSKRWEEPERCYREWHRSGFWRDGDVGSGHFGLGQIQAVVVDSNITVVNMVAQHGYYPKTEPPYVHYEALEKCLEGVERIASSRRPPYSVHMPRIGCGLGGGTWEEVEPIIERTLVDAGVRVFVYDL